MYFATRRCCERTLQTNCLPRVSHVRWFLVFPIQHRVVRLWPVLLTGEAAEGSGADRVAGRWLRVCVRSGAQMASWEKSTMLSHLFDSAVLDMLTAYICDSMTVIVM